MRDKTVLIFAAIALALASALAGAGLYALVLDHQAATQAVADSGAPQQQQRPAGGPVATALPAKRFGGWALQCSLPTGGAKQCLLMMQVAEQKTRRVLMRLVVAQNKGNTILTVVVPPSALLSQGVTLTPDKGGAQKADFAQCLPGVCRAQHDLDDGMIAAISASTTMKVGYVQANGQPVNYALPVTGFAEGLAALKAS